jgi:hypothetical protein
MQEKPTIRTEDDFTYFTHMERVVAIHKDKFAIIESLINEYGGISKVPKDKEVEGFDMIKDMNTNELVRYHLQVKFKINELGYFWFNK